MSSAKDITCTLKGGIFRTMANDQEKFEREERAKRLKAARESAGFSGARAVVAASDGKINENVYKAHEQGRNGFTVSDGRVYADLFNVSLVWLYLGLGSSRKIETETPETRLRSAMLAFGVSPTEIGRAVSAVKLFVDETDEQSEQDPHRDQSELSTRHRSTTP